MRYYRYGAQPPHYQYNWNGQLKSSQKPPMLQFGSDEGNVKLAALPLAVGALGVYFFFIRKNKRGKTLFDRTVLDAMGW